MQNQRFGRLTVVGPAERKGRQKRWLCECDCGKTTTSFEFSLKAGKSKSCGCIAAEKSKLRWQNPNEAQRKAQSDKSKTHGLSKHPMYQSWVDMRQRCNAARHKWFHSYGGRGIKVCAQWNTSFEVFWGDMHATWFPKAQLGRKDNDGPYNPDNCRWENPRQQQRNKSNSPRIQTALGLLPVCEVATQNNLSTSCLMYRIKAGWPQDRLLIPSQRKKT